MTTADTYGGAQHDARSTNFEPTPNEVASIDRLDTGKRGGPEPEAITLEGFGRDIAEA